MKKFKYVSAFIFIIFLISLLFSGCIVRKTPDDTKGNENNNGDYSHQLGTNALEQDNIVQAVKKVQGVQDAVVITMEDTAYVGIDLDISKNMDNIYKIQNIKEKTANTVRSADSEINTVYVSTDSDFIEKISKISKKIRNGEPIESFVDELNKVVKEVTYKKE